jgi:coenzyme F420 hydrogenase subunit beta
MQETPGGLLFATVDRERCTGCGLCVRACGGWHLAEGLLLDTFDPFKGNVIEAFCSYASDPAVRVRGQSGGAVTALLASLFESGRIDAAPAIRMPDDGSLRPEPFLARCRQDLFQSQGSQYCPVALNSLIPTTVGQDGCRIALAGLPCHMHSLRNVQQFDPYWRKGVVLRIGLFCDRTLAYGAIDYLIGQANVLRRDVISLRFRDKARDGWPGSIVIRTRAGQEIHVPSRERIAVKDYFTPARCRLCFDKMNVLCDIAVGDAWGINEGRQGFSVLIARTPAGASVVEEARKNGFLTSASVGSDNIFKGQGVEKRRELWTAFTHIARSAKKELPEHHIDAKFTGRFTEKQRNFAAAQSRWTDTFFKGRKTDSIVRAVKLRQRVQKIRKLFGRTD